MKRCGNNLLHKCHPHKSSKDYDRSDTSWKDEIENEEMSKLINADCLTALKDIPDDSIDCIVTSPPYNLKGLKGVGVPKTSPARWNGKYKQATYGLDYAGDNMREEDYQQWQVDILNECYRVIKPGGSVFYNHKNRRFKCQLYSPMEFIDRCDLVLHQQIIWDRCSSHIPCPGMLGNSTEFIYWLRKEKPVVYKPDGLLWKCEVWRQMPVQGKKRPNHPAPFPIELPTNCILLTTQPGDVVLDPFAGSGTTLVAAKQLGREYIGIEVSKEYCELIGKRLNDILEF